MQDPQTTGLIERLFTDGPGALISAAVLAIGGLLFKVWAPYWVIARDEKRIEKLEIDVAAWQKKYDEREREYRAEAREQDQILKRAVDGFHLAAEVTQKATR